MSKEHSAISLGRHWVLCEHCSNDKCLLGHAEIEEIEGNLRKRGAAILGRIQQVVLYASSLICSKANNAPDAVL